VRWWVRLLSVAVPLLMSPFVWVQPLMLNPEWQRDGMPASEWFWAAVLYVVMGLLAWSAFHSRIELGDGQLRVVNPWRSHVVSTADVVDVKPGSLGVEFLLSSGLGAGRGRVRGPVHGLQSRSGIAMGRCRQRSDRTSSTVT
jgi:hypothetical protein